MALSIALLAKRGKERRAFLLDAVVGLPYAVSSTILAWLAAFGWPAFITGGSGANHVQGLVCAYGLAFFAVDVIPTLFGGDALAIVHHLIAIGGYAKVLFDPTSNDQVRLACALLVTEASTPLLFAWKRAKLDASTSEHNTFRLFVASFFCARPGFLTWLLYADMMDGAPWMEDRVSLILVGLLLLLNVVWTGGLLHMLANYVPKYKKAAAAASKKR
eukprot:g5812.t1